jgi:hypothetical protein
MKYLNKRQLAFILEIPVEDARAKMCVAWCKAEGIQNAATYDGRNKIVDSYPEAMPIEVLSAGLNLPTLKESADDIEQNYLTRPATKKWILCDYPEKKIALAYKDERKPELSIPSGLKSMLPDVVATKILDEWAKRYPFAKIKP